MSIHHSFLGGKSYRSFGKRQGSIGIILPLLLILSVLAAFSLYLRTLSTSLAASMAQDAVVSAVNRIVRDRVSENDFDLISFEKDAGGNITAVTANTAALNRLSNDILLTVSNEAADHDIEISIPLGTLTGSTLLLSRGPDIKVRIHVLSSAFLGFQSEMESIGINQSRHRIILQLREELTLITPWHSVDTETVIDIPVAETVIVGQVPQSYFNLGE